MTPPASREDMRPPGGPENRPGSQSGSRPGSGPARFQPSLRTASAETRSPMRVLGAGLALALLVVGVPLALLWLAGPLSWPGSLPGRDDLTGSIGIEQVLAVLLVVAWIAWAQFAICVVVEVAAARRGGVLARPVPFSGPSQRLARALVGSVLVAGVIGIQAGTAFAATAPAPRTDSRSAASVSASADQDSSGSAIFAPGGVVPDGSDALSGTGDAGPDATTAPGDGSLSTQAAISRASVEAQHPVVHTHHGSASSATPAGQDDDADLHGRKVYVVEPTQGRHHDSLWAIAEAHLGDGRRYHEIYALNEGRVQPDGRTLHLARLIQPGWQLIMPDDATGVPRYVSQGGGSAGSAGRSASDAGGRAASQAQSSPSATHPATSPTTASGSSPATHPVTEPATQAAPQNQATTLARTGPAGGDRSVITGWPGTELLGAGLLGAALLSTVLLVRRRRGGVPPEDPAAEAEVWLRAGAEADRSALLDRALRTISTLCVQTGQSLPQAYGAVVDDGGIDLLLSVPQPGAPHPWTDLAGGSRWHLRTEDGDELGDPEASAYPLLASVGRDDQGRDALINLGAAGGPVTVLGSPAMALAVVRALALSLAGNPWSRGIEVLTCDLPQTLPAIAAGRLIACASAEDVTQQLEAGGPGRLVRCGPAEVLTGGPVPGSRPERVAIYGKALSPSTSRRVEKLTRSTGNELALLMSGDLTAARWRLLVDDHGRLTCDELSLAVTAHRLGDGSIDRLHALFVAAAQPAPNHGLTAGTPPALAPPLLEADDVAWAQASARVAVLGDPQGRGDGTIDPGHQVLATEVVAYLALHPDGAHPTVLGSAIWPRGVTADVRDETIARVRAWLGTDPDGQFRIRAGHDGRIRLSPNVVLDWDVLRTLLSRARSASIVSRERDLLVRALHLVRGPIVGGADVPGYSWLARLDVEQQAEDLIIDAADRLSQLCADEHDNVGVAQAAAAGLRARPDAQILWRHILRAEHALGGRDRLAAVIKQMKDALRDEGTDMEPQTQALADHLLAPAGSLPAGRQHSVS